MKKLMFFALTLCGLLSSCDQVPTIEKTVPTYTVSFNLQLLPEVVPFPDSRSIPDTQFSEPEIEDNTEPPVTPGDLSFDYISYFIFDTKTKEIIDENEISKDKEDFGSYLYLDLPVGSFQITVICHSSTEKTKKEKSLYMKDLTDTFLGTNTFTIEAGSFEGSFKVPMIRKVSRVEFVPTDDIPEQVKAFHISLPERYTKINLLTGDTDPEKEEYEYERIFSDEEKNYKEKITHSFYTFVPKQEGIKLSKAVLTLKDKNDKILQQKEVPNIPIYQNRITQYTGILYSPDMAEGTFELDFTDGGKWGETDKRPLP